MSLHASRPRAVSFLTALTSIFALGAALSGCTREPAAPAADATKTASAPKAGADTAKATPAPAGSDATKSPAAPGAAVPPGATAAAGSPGAPNPAAAAAAKRAADADKDKARQASAEMVPVETAVIVRGPISAFLPFNTTLETESSVDIFPQTSGQVETLLVEEGRIVKEGDPLLKIEDRELRIDVEESSTNYEHLLTNFGRTEDLFKRNLVNKQEYEDHRFQLDQARIRNERAKVRLSYATVRAPVSGVISAREAQVGARVGTGTKLFSMVKLDDLVARVFVPGRYLPVVAVDQAAIVNSEFLPDRNFSGWVKRISPVIDPKSGTFKVTVGVRTEKPNELPPGLFVGVRVITDTRANAILVPKRAILYEGGERYLFVVDKGKALKKKLTVGYEDPNNVEALSGFEPGTVVITLGQSGLKDGQLVRSVNATPAPAAAVKAAPAVPGGPAAAPAAPAATSTPAAPKPSTP